MNKNNSSFFVRFIKLILSVLILSAFIISIALLVKELKNTDQTRIAVVVHKVLGYANIDIQQEQVEQVAGDFIDRLSDSDISSMSTHRDISINDKNIDSLDTNLNKSDNQFNDLNNNSEDTIDVNSNYYSIALISDIHQDLAALDRSLNKIKDLSINEVIVIGDLTNYGDIKSLEQVKEVLDDSGLTYYVLPGDHDLAQSVGPSNYIQVYGNTFYQKEINGFTFTFIDNSANFTTILPSNMSFIKNNIANTDYIVTSQPLYTDELNIPFKKMYMGSTFSDIDTNLEENQQKVKEQRDIILEMLRDSNIKGVLSGDHHKSSIKGDPINNNLSHYIFGSISSDLNGLPQSLIQSPRFSVINVYDNGNLQVEDIEIL